MFTFRMELTYKGDGRDTLGQIGEERGPEERGGRDWWIDCRRRYFSPPCAALPRTEYSLAWASAGLSHCQGIHQGCCKNPVKPKAGRAQLATPQQRGLWEGPSWPAAGDVLLVWETRLTTASACWGMTFLGRHMVFLFYVPPLFLKQLSLYGQTQIRDRPLCGFLSVSCCKNPLRR